MQIKTEVPSCYPLIESQVLHCGQSSADQRKIGDIISLSGRKARVFGIEEELSEFLLNCIQREISLRFPFYYSLHMLLVQSHVGFWTDAEAVWLETVAQRYVQQEAGD